MIFEYYKNDYSENSFGYYYTVNDKVYFFAKSLMNNCGDKIYAFFKKNMFKHIVVVHDELEIPFLQMKVKYGGSEKGHNGLRSISSLFGQNYVRVRLGIGRPLNITVSDFVLGKFSKEEQKQILSSSYLESFHKLLQSIDFAQLSS